MFSLYRSKILPRTYAECEALYPKASARRGNASGKLAHNTYLVAWERPHDGATVYGVRLHRTIIVTFEPDGSATLDTGGCTFTTRARMRDCGFRVGMAGGIPSLSWGGVEHLYRDLMRLEPSGRVTGPAVSGTPLDARKARRRVLARSRRNPALPDPWRWPGRSGGRTPYRGTAPEALALPQYA